MHTDTMLNAALPATAPEWVMIARAGEWRGHPAGEERITPDDLAVAHAYYERHYAANGADLVVDYEHASTSARLLGGRAPAAGWITAMELRAGGTELWAHVQWTTEAATSIEAREYRYLSPVLRWGHADRVTGEPVRLQIHSVALTNVPFMTELQALNANDLAAGTDAGGIDATPTGGPIMDLLTAIAGALGVEPSEAAGLLGVEAEADDGAVAAAIKALADRVAALDDEAAPDDEADDDEAAAGEADAETDTTGEAGADDGAVDDGDQADEGGGGDEAAAVPAEVAHALGIGPEADLTAVRARILALRGASGVDTVAHALGCEADLEAVLAAIAELQSGHLAEEHESLVAHAIEAGRVPPAMRDYWLHALESDPEAARQALDSLPEIVAGAAARQADTPGPRLTPRQQEICARTGLTPTQFLATLG